MACRGITEAIACLKQRLVHRVSRERMTRKPEALPKRVEQKRKRATITG